MKAFSKGLITGISATLITAAASLFAVKKTVIEPEIKKEQFVTDNKKKAARKRIAH